MIVLDASAAVALFLRRPASSRIAARIATQPIHVPQFFDLEVVSSLRSIEARREDTGGHIPLALQDLQTMRCERHPHRPLLARVWELRGHVTAYDAVYIALAETLSAPMITCDRNLSRAPGHRATIELFT